MLKSITSHGRSALVGLLIAASLGRCAGQIFQELYSFSAGADGLTPSAALVQGRDGNFYGTTKYGPGPLTEDWLGYGTVFRITPQGALTTIFVFNWTNGAYPSGALLQAADGNFYGTTSAGYGSAGSLFKMTPGGQLTTLTWFGGGVGYGAGADPVGDLIEGPDGKLYGVTRDGGDGNSHGTVFRISTNGIIENLHFFYGVDGLYPSGGLLLASDGNLYGVTAGGGWCNGNGAIYRVTTNGTVTTVASFCQGPGNAVWPRGKLMKAEDGNFYGAAGGGVGTIFRMTLDGTLSTFDRFNGYTGSEPVGGLVEANDGAIYGSSYNGGSNYGFGSVFRLGLGQGCTDHTWNSCGNLSALVWFGETGSGAYPYAGLILGSDGNLYGATAFGGSHGAGIIFRIIMPGPRLNSERLGQNLVLSWRTNYTGYGLQSSTDLAGNQWTDCTNPPSLVGGRYFITNSISGTSLFFRLSRISQPAGAARHLRFTRTQPSCSITPPGTK